VNVYRNLLYSSMHVSVSRRKKKTLYVRTKSRNSIEKCIPQRQFIVDPFTYMRCLSQPSTAIWRCCIFLLCACSQHALSVPFLRAERSNTFFPPTLKTWCHPCPSAHFAFFKVNYIETTNTLGFRTFVRTHFYSRSSAWSESLENLPLIFG
jgi:hypothetical protein